MRHSTTLPALFGTISSRRAFLKRGMMIGAAIPVVGSVLAACGREDADDETPAAARGPAPTATAASTANETPAGAPSPAKMDATATSIPEAGGASTAPASPGAEQPAVGALRLTDGAVAWTVSSLVEAYRTVMGVSDEIVLIKENMPLDASGSSSQHTIALNAADGAELWRRTAGAMWIPSGPCDGQGIVVLADQNAGALVGVDVATGEERWHVESSAAPIANSSTVTVVWYEDDYFGGPNDTSQLSGIDRLTGDELWVSDLLLFEQSGNVVARSPAAVIDEVLVFPAGSVGTGGVVGDATVTALDMRTGAILWQAPPLNDPVVAEGVVVGTRGRLADLGTIVAIDATSGEELWTASGQVSYGDLLAVGDGVLVVMDLGENQGFGLIAYELSSGSERWRVIQTIDSAGQPQLIDGTSLVLLWEGQLVVRSTTDGAMIWAATEPFGSPLMNSVGSNGNTLFVAINSLAWAD